MPQTNASFRVPSANPRSNSNPDRKQQGPTMLPISCTWPMQHTTRTGCTSIGVQAGRSHPMWRGPPRTDFVSRPTLTLGAIAGRGKDTDAPNTHLEPSTGRSRVTSVARTVGTRSHTYRIAARRVWPGRISRTERDRRGGRAAARAMSTGKTGPHAHSPRSTKPVSLPGGAARQHKQAGNLGCFTIAKTSDAKKQLPQAEWFHGSGRKQFFTNHGSVKRVIAGRRGSVHAPGTDQKAWVARTAPVAGNHWDTALHNYNPKLTTPTRPLNSADHAYPGMERQGLLTKRAPQKSPEKRLTT